LNEDAGANVFTSAEEKRRPFWRDFSPREVLGLATRFATLGLLLMTGVIQLVVPDGWANFHLPSAAMAIAIMPLGPGLLSLVRLINR
jgi:hypothetical protein